MAFITALNVTATTGLSQGRADVALSSRTCQFVSCASTVTLRVDGGSATAATQRTSGANRPSDDDTRRSKNSWTTIRCSDMGLEFPEKKYTEGSRIGVIRTRWNDELVSALHTDVVDTLKADGVKEDDIVQMTVPGAFELPMAARLMCAAQKVDAVVVLGVLIKGETEHYDYLASSVSSGLMDLQLTLSTPMVFGVLCCPDEKTAADRSTGDKSHAQDWAKTAMEMATLKKSQLGGVSAGKKSVGFF